MKTMIILALFLTGCSSYYYKPDISLTQASKDDRECKFEADRASYDLDALYEVQLYNECMRIRGYLFYAEEDKLPSYVVKDSSLGVAADR